MRLYTIEKGGVEHSGQRQYRFVSLYNGMRGPWCSKNRAKILGDQHQRIIESIHGGKK